jgi:hypothetical protein
MTIREIRKRARTLGVTLETNNKADLIRAVQAAEANPQCFRTGRMHCEQTKCCWLEDCIPQQFAEMNQSAGIGARTETWRR